MTLQCVVELFYRDGTSKLYGPFAVAEDAQRWAMNVIRTTTVIEYYVRPMERII